MAASVSLLVAMVLVGQLLTGARSERHFEVFEGDWDTCKRINSSATCYRTRDVHCRAAVGGKPAPWRHCAGSGPRPPSVEECPQCQQDCVVTMWSEWTPCAGSREVYTTRRRSVAAPRLQNGGPCPALQETKRCGANPATISQLERLHSWKLGLWTECEPFDERDCGPGTRNRSVECVDLRGRTVNRTLCLQEEAYLHVLPPPLAKLCEVPCPCRLGEWSEWSRSSPDCTLPSPILVQRRTRGVEHHPTLGGDLCGALEEVRTFSGDVQCPTNYWEASRWAECAVQDEETSCGPGFRRRYTYCMEEDTDGVVKQVDPERCNSTERPTTLDPCVVPCVQQCVVSEWTSWSHCPNNTCEATLSSRTRTVLVEPYGYTCPHLTEVQECPSIPCAQWVPDKWSACFVIGHDCGWGSQSRNTICRDAAGSVVNNHCTHLTLPNQVDKCYKHCSNDTCVVSDWGEWSACSESCDDIAGVRSRSRYVAVNGSGSCEFDEGELSQEESCSMDTPCKFPVFHVEYGEWGDCLVPSNATRDSEMCSGVRSRAATCYRDGEEVLDSECLIDSRLMEEPCSVPCSTDCVMSDWSTLSECSDACSQTRSRRLLKFGDSCPSVDKNGFEIQNVPCDCGSVYGWVTGDSWSDCQAFPTPLSQTSHNSIIPNPSTLCGMGYHTRSVKCQDGDRAVVSERDCDIRSKPSSVRACVVPCSERCVVTDWTDYSMCTTGTSVMERTREIVPFSGYDNYLDNCPELASVAQVDGQTCPSHDFTEFVWTISYELGDLHRCYLPPDKVCGPGESYRAIGCTNTSVAVGERTAASPEFCASVQPLPLATVMVCNEDCNIDCEYADPGWSAWSQCSVTCGTGVQTRTRGIQRVSRGGGRECDHLSETTTCEMPACDFFKHSYTLQSVCQPSNTTLGCGLGVSTSDLICFMNGVLQPNTSGCDAALGLKARQKIFFCQVPCDDECVWSEWSAFEWCPECRDKCYKRTRHILRQGSNCGGVTEHFAPCSMDEPFWWTGNWTDCIVEGTPRDDYCGAGIQRRKVECQLGDKGATYEEVCSQLTKPDTARGCSVPCPVDCVVDVFSEWSSCGECSSDLRATVTRWRRVLAWPENGGRSCPHLLEERACPNVGCDEYFVETNSSALDCSAESTDGVCGLVSHTVLLCRRNTEFVELEECLKANANGKIVHNAELLHRRGDVYCDIECPAMEECEFAGFWPWSECLLICGWSPENRFQFRTRTLRGSWEGSQETCHNRQLEVRVCPPITGATTNETGPGESERCIKFDWVAYDWHPNNTRDVQCHGNGSHVEDSACIESLHPVTKRDAQLDGLCDCPFLGECDKETTECFCRDGFEMAASLCLPIEGCIADSLLWVVSQQCLPQETCSDSGECVCPEGRDCTTAAPPSTGGVPTPTVAMGTSSTEDTGTGGVPTSTVAVGTSPTGEETGTKPSEILMIALVISVPLLIFIVILLVVIIVTCKCRQHLDKRRRRRPPPVILHQNQQLNNRSDATATKHSHDLKGGGVRVQEIPLDATSHPMHLHNGSASSGFVEEMEHYAQASFNGYSQTTQSDVDEAGFAAAGNPYAPYPLPDDPPSVPFTPTTPHPPYVPYEVEERDSIPYHHHRGNGMGPVLEPHPFSRSLSEEAHLAEMASGRVGGGYDSRLEEEEPQFSQDLPDHLGHHHGPNFYSPSPASSRTHPHSHHSHHHHSHHHHHGNSGGRDNRMMAGMDLSMVRAIEQVSASEAGSRSPSVSSMGSRSSARRSGRRRHHHRGHHHPRLHSPVGGPSHSAQGYYGYYQPGERDSYQSNTLPRSGSKTASPHMAPRSPRHHMTSEASPLVGNTTTPPGRYVRSASNEILEARRQQRHLRPPLEESRDGSHDHRRPPPVEMPPALPDEYPLVYHATNPISASPLPPSSQASGEGDYDHIRPATVTTPRVPAPPPLPSGNLKPPTATLGVPPPSTSASSSPHSPRSPSSPSSTSSSGPQQFPQELTSAIQRRANAISLATPTSSTPQPSGAPPPPPRTVSAHQGGRGRSRNTAARFSPAMMSAYTKENPPTPPNRGVSSLHGQNNSLASNHTGAPPPPPPPPIRSS